MADVREIGAPDEGLTRCGRAVYQHATVASGWETQSLNSYRHCMRPQATSALVFLNTATRIINSILIHCYCLKGLRWIT